MARQDSLQQQPMYDIGIISAEEDNDEVTYFIELLRHNIHRKLLFSSIAPGNDNEDTDNTIDFMHSTLTCSHVNLFYVTPAFTKSHFAKFFTEQKFVQRMYFAEDFQRKCMVLHLCKESYRRQEETNSVMTFLKIFRKHDISFLRSNYLREYRLDTDIESFIDLIPEQSKSKPRSFQRFLDTLSRILPPVSNTQVDERLDTFPMQETAQQFQLNDRVGDITTDGPESWPSSQVDAPIDESLVNTERSRKLVDLPAGAVGGDAAENGDASSLGQTESAIQSKQTPQTKVGDRCSIDHVNDRNTKTPEVKAIVTSIDPLTFSNGDKSLSVAVPHCDQLNDQCEQGCSHSSKISQISSDLTNLSLSSEGTESRLLQVSCGLLTSTDTQSVKQQQLPENAP